MIAAFVPDLMDRSKFGSGAVRFVRSADAAAGADCVVVDLDRCDDLQAFAALDCRTIGFASHVDGDRMADAASAGFDEVLARSVFFRRLPDLLHEQGGTSPVDG